MNVRRPWVTLLISVIAVLLGGGALTVAITTDNGNGGQQTHNITFKVNEAPGDGAPSKTLTAPAAGVAQVASQLPDQHMRDETPPLASKVAPGELTAAQKAAARIRATQRPLPTAGASGGFAGCLTRFVRNQSSRNGVRPQDIVDHYTVSHNVPGWADVLSVVALFDRTSAQASSNFVIDGEGHCAYIVPIEAKAWAQAAFNPFAVSFEVIDYGNEATYMADPGFLKLAQVQLEVSKRTGIPLVRGAVRGCVPTKKGILQHADLGLCGGGHHDVEPFSINSIVSVTRKLAYPPKPAPKFTSGQRQRCQELNRIRRKRAKTAADYSRASQIRAGEARSHVACRFGPPGRLERR